MGKDFKIITTKGDGPGGQHKNKTESCVVITHIPTGMTERCQDTRSQLKNKTLAMDRLLKRIDDLKKEINDEKINDHRVSISKERIKTYNYKTGLVTDHRTNKKALLNRVLNGELDLLK